MPLVHTATFTMEDKPQILVTAMQACGALYVRTRTAMNFINSALTSARDELVAEFVSPLSHDVTRPHPRCTQERRDPRI